MKAIARAPHHRGFAITVAWTVGLIWLGSAVHATGSSLACPDWPTCYGEWMPAMEGGIFWEHLHRLVAGGLVLLFLGATYLAWRDEPERPWLWKAGVAGIFLLLVQSVLGGVTVIMELPTAISTAHLSLALLFLILAVALSAATSPRWGRKEAEDGPEPEADARVSADTETRRRLGWAAIAGLVLVLGQSLLGGLVRHTGAAMACPDVPLCYGQVVPPLESSLIAAHFAHRVVGIVVAAALVAVAWMAFRSGAEGRVRRAGLAAGVLVVAQVGLGFLSVLTQLDVLVVSLHTAVAALLVVLLTAMAAWCLEPAATAARSPEPASDPAGEEPRSGPAFSRAE